MAQPTITNNLSLVPMMANMSLVNAQAQNQALQANNAANAQLLQALEKIQAVFQVSVEEIARLNARIVTLEAQIKTSDQLHEQQMKALIDQVNAVQKQAADTAQKEVDHLAKTVALEQKSTSVEQNVNALKDRYEKHAHNYYAPYGIGAQQIYIGTSGPNC